MAAEHTNGMKGLTSEQIADLMAKTRTRGAYEAPLKAFMESDEAAINVKDSFPIFANKNASTLYQGFVNEAKREKIADEVDVKKLEEQVYLFHKERVAALSAV